MVKEAKAHEEEDKKAKEKVDARNNAESMLYSTERSLKNYGDKVSQADKQNIQSKLDDLKNTLSNQNATTEELKAKSQALQEASYKLAEAIYKTQGQAGQQGAPNGGNPTGSAGTSGPTSHQGTGPDDAGYEVVN